MKRTKNPNRFALLGLLLAVATSPLAGQSTEANRATLQLTLADKGPNGSSTQLQGITPQGQSLWRIDLGMISAIKVATSPSGQTGVVLVGDTRGSGKFQATPGSGNTLYIISTLTGDIQKTLDPLQGWKAAPWADAIWQNLNLQANNDSVVVSGPVFSYPFHPNPINFSTNIPYGNIASPNPQQTQTDPSQKEIETKPVIQRPHGIEW